MSDNKKPKNERIALLVVIVIALVTLALYVFVFRNRPPGDPEEWGQFGDYLTGVMSPVIGIVTVLLIIKTLRVTREEAENTRKLMILQNEHTAAQVRHLEDEKQRADLHRKLEGALAEWNRLLDSAGYRLMFGTTDRQPRLTSREESLRKIFDSDSILREVRKASAVLSDRLAENWQGKLSVAIGLLTEIADYCEEYDAITGNRTLSDFYRRRVSNATEMIFAAGALPDRIHQSLSVISPYKDVAE